MGRKRWVGLSMTPTLFSTSNFLITADHEFPCERSNLKLEYAITAESPWLFPKPYYVFYIYLLYVYFFFYFPQTKGVCPTPKLVAGSKRQREQMWCWFEITSLAASLLAPPTAHCSSNSKSLKIGVLEFPPCSYWPLSRNTGCSNRPQNPDRLALAKG